MNIYDEAIALEIEAKENRLQLTKEKYQDLDDIKLGKIIKSKSDKHDKVIKAIERAKNEHELLELYRKRFCFLNFDEDKGLREIKALEDELK